MTTSYKYGGKMQVEMHTHDGFEQFIVYRTQWHGELNLLPILYGTCLNIQTPGDCGP